jgi:hypothetical protein
VSLSVVTTLSDFKKSVEYKIIIVRKQMLLLEDFIVNCLTFLTVYFNLKHIICFNYSVHIFAALGKRVVCGTKILLQDFK